MKLVKTRLQNRISDINLARLMRIAIEGPEPADIDFLDRKITEYTLKYDHSCANTKLSYNLILLEGET